VAAVFSGRQFGGGGLSTANLDQRAAGGDGVSAGEEITNMVE
jgi:hypothetical protein